MTKTKNLIQVSDEAYRYLHRLAKSDDYDKARGIVGVVDIHLFGHYTTKGRGSYSRKNSLTKG